MQNAYYREFYSEKDVVMEERRLSENRPGFLFGEQVTSSFYAASPYSWSVLGWMDDLKRITKDDILEFRNRYYVPNNAVAIYVGDFDPDKVLALAKKYFGRIPKGADVEPIRTLEPEQKSHKRLYGTGPSQTNLQMLFHTPPAGHPDTAPLSILASALGSGGGMGRFRPGGGSETGRLQKLLIKEKEMAVSVSASSRPQWYVGMFRFSASPRIDKNVKPEDLETEILAEIEKIKNEGLTDNEIQKAKNKAEARFIRGLSSTAGLARTIGRAELHRGWETLVTDLEALKAVTNEDIKRVASTYFVKDNSLTAVYEREMRGMQGRRGPRPEGARPGSRTGGQRGGQS
jgi:predicted Zn-dependent peptidase